MDESWRSIQGAARYRPKFKRTLLTDFFNTIGRKQASQPYLVLVQRPSSLGKLISGLEPFCVARWRCIQAASRCAFGEPAT